MRTIALYEMLYGILTIVGGIIGYSTTGYWEPLVAGLAAGVMLIGGALKMQKGARSGIFTTLFVTVLLLAYGIYRMTEDGTFMPGGVMIILSAISVLLLFALLVQPKERKRIF
jgi:uncharacterized membrane protein (UPF0136 family)